MLSAIPEMLRERHEFFIRLLWEHILIAGTAIVLAAVFGLLLGIVISEWGRLSPWIIGLSNIVYTIPSIALLGFLIPFTGIGNTTAVIALTVYALLPVIVNTHAGLKNIEPDIVESARGMGSGRWQLLWKIKLPLALPVILSGMKAMVVMTIALAGIASFIGAGGLGVAIYRGIATNNMVMTLCGSLLIAALAVAGDRAIALAQRSIPWLKGAAHE